MPVVKNHCGTGILPVPPTPQENLVFVEKARCLFLRIIVEQARCLFLRMVKEVRLINVVFNYIVALKYCKVQGIFKVCR
jgi:hypothetical protein